MIRNELGLFNESLLHRTELVVINKAELFDSDPTILERARKILRDELFHLRGQMPTENEPLLISCVSNKGIPELLYALKNHLKVVPIKEVQLP